MSETAMMHDPQQDYDLKKVLGRGSFGAVYFAIRKEDGQECAVKRLEVAQEKQMNSVLREIDIMKGVDSPHIVKYFANYFWKKEIWIVMEFAGKGSLSSVLDKEAKVDPPRGFKDESRIASVAAGVLGGLLYMHKRNVVHRDIKSDNVLIANDGALKLADFGISRRITDADTKMGTMIGTPHYLAPEVVLAEGEGGYTAKVDVWSLGIVCLEMADGRPPFADLNPMKVLFELANNPVCKLKEPLSRWTAMFVSFTEFCCKANPVQRPSADHMIKHPFLNNVQPYLRFPDQAGGGGGGSAPAASSGAAAPSANAGGGSAIKQSRPSSNSNPPAVQKGASDDPQTLQRKQEKRQAIQMFNRGIELSNAGRHDEAIQMYIKALELDPKHVGSLTNLGVALISKKDFDGAIKQFLLVCEQRPNSADNFVNVGVAYANKKDYASALQAFETAMNLDPNHAVAKSMHRRCQSDQRKSEMQKLANPGAAAAAASPSVPRANSNKAPTNGAVSSGRFDPNVESVPPLVTACVQYLMREEESSNVDVFQEAGDAAVIQECKAQFDAGRRPDLSAIGSHNVAGLLWLWCHELPEPLLTHGLRDRWIAAAGAASEGGIRVLQALGECISMLPPGSRAVLQVLLELLSTIHTYQNAASRLGAFFAQELLWPPANSGQQPTDPRAARVVELLIMYHGDLFPNRANFDFPAAPPMDMAPPPMQQQQQQQPPQMQRAPLSRGGAGGSIDHRSANNSSSQQQQQQPEMSMGGNDPFGYYEAGIVFKNWSRDEAEAKLAASPGGAYLVRPSSQPNCLSVSYKAADTGRVGHLLLSKPSATVPGWTTDGRPRPYPSIRDLLKSLPYGLELSDPIVK